MTFINSFIHRVCCAYSAYDTIPFFSSQQLAVAALFDLYTADIKKKFYFGFIFFSDCLQQGSVIYGNILFLGEWGADHL